LYQEVFAASADFLKKKFFKEVNAESAPSEE